MFQFSYVWRCCLNNSHLGFQREFYSDSVNPWAIRMRQRRLPVMKLDVGQTDLSQRES